MTEPFITLISVENLVTRRFQHSGARNEQGEARVGRILGFEGKFSSVTDPNCIIDLQFTAVSQSKLMESREYTFRAQCILIYLMQIDL